MEKIIILSNEKIDNLSNIYNLIFGHYKTEKNALVGNKESWTKLTVIKKKNLIFSNNIEFSSFSEEKDPEILENNYKKPLFNIFSAIETKSLIVKYELLVKIRRANFLIEVKAKSLNEILNLSQNIKKEINGFSIMNDSKVFDLDENLVLDLEGNSKVSDLGLNLNVEEDQLIRKEKSEKLLKEKKVPIHYSLTFLPSEKVAQIRTKEEIVKRALALAIVSFKALTLDEKLVKDLILIYKAEDFFTEEENNFLKLPINKIEESERLKFIWRTESCLVLLWTLNKVDKLEYPLESLGMEAIPNLLPTFKNFNSFNKTAHVKTTKEILDQNDFIFRCNRTLIYSDLNENSKITLNPSVVNERHHALNWLINYKNQDWDEINT